MSIRLQLVSILLVALCSCSSNTKTLEERPMLINPFDKLPQYVAELRDEKRLIAKSRDMAARKQISNEALKQFRKELFTDLPNFDARVSINMTETADKIAGFIAAAAQYDYIKPKNTPLAPVVISLHLEDATLHEVLRELNSKVGHLAVIQIHTTPRRTLRLEYKND